MIEPIIIVKILIIYRIAPIIIEVLSFIFNVCNTGIINFYEYITLHIKLILINHLIIVDIVKHLSINISLDIIPDINIIPFILNIEIINLRFIIILLTVIIFREFWLD